MKRLAVVWHSRTGAAEALAGAAFAAARAVEGVEARLLAAETTQPGDLLKADGFVFAAPENLAALSGAMKDLLDRAYYPLLGRIEGRPYAAIIAAGSDGSGALAQLERILTGWRLRRAAEPLIANFAAQTPEAILAPKQPGPDLIARATGIGALLGEGLALGLW